MMSKFDSFPVRRALISVYDKTGLVEFARALRTLNIEILSTGGTATLLQAQNIPVTEVSQCTGFPEMMDGRVKTLHPKIHAALLGRRGVDEAVMQAHGIEPIDLLVVNLYPFQQVISQPKTTLDTAIEFIDIGGPAMLRAAAKNYAAVACVVSPSDYDIVLEEMRQKNGAVSPETRFQLAKKVFAHTAQYDGAIANYLGVLNAEGEPASFPDTYSCQLIKKQDLRYGENPHQHAAFYVESQPAPGTMASANQLQGKALSFNNIADADAALTCVKGFRRDKPTCVIVKHANPCGIAQAASAQAAYQRAYLTDPTSSFGGIIAFNCPLDEATAAQIVQNQFAEVIIAPEASDKAQAVLSTKPNIRLLTTGYWPAEPALQLDYKRVQGGLLIQETDTVLLDPARLQVVTEKQPTAAMHQDLLFAWEAVKHIKSNAIVFVKDAATLGIGAGQMSRIDSVRIGAQKAADAKFDLRDAILASDAFFPFPDSIEQASNLGVTAIIQPGGSIRDHEVIHAANRAGLVMLFTGQRHFRH